MLPAASRAVTVITFVPVCNAIPVTFQVLVPLAVPLPPRLLLQVTCATPTLSLAVPETVVVEVVRFAPLAGLVIETVGGVASSCSKCPILGFGKQSYALRSSSL